MRGLPPSSISILPYTRTWLHRIASHRLRMVAAPAIVVVIGNTIYRSQLI
jgi:hypothetical protein